MQLLRLPDVPRVYTSAERDAIRKQLDRMLASPLFRNSKRYPTLLRYVVEHALEGDTSALKERTLGVDVFGRQPDYDTNADPIVRATAGEIRKRIAQYYHEHGHESEVRIELTPRSYVPEFEFPLRTQPAAIPITLPDPSPEPPPATVALVRTARRLRWRVVAGAALCGMLLLFGTWLRPAMMLSAVDRFWRPVLESSSSVLICVGQRGFLGSMPEPGQVISSDLPTPPNGPITLFQLYYLGSQNVALADVRTISRLAGLLQAKGKAFTLRGQSSTNFADLRDQPVILVGAMNNDWTMRLMGNMRFSFERDGDEFWIRDRRTATHRNRVVNYRTPYLNLTEDYALISRTLDPTTERMEVLAGGLTGYGTTAAGEFLTNPAYLEAFAKDAPAGWDRKNMQIVLATKVIEGNSGPPRVIERYFW
jgi:hypothetical protein